MLFLSVYSVCSVVRLFQQLQFFEKRSILVARFLSLTFENCSFRLVRHRFYYEILDDLPLGDQVHDRQEEEGFVGGAMADRGRPAMTASIGVETGKLR